jgi:hypothetical protein
MNVWACVSVISVYNDKTFGLSLYLRSAGFEPAIPSLGSSYLNQSGLTSLNQQIHSTINKFLSLLKHHKLEYLFNHDCSDNRKLDLVLVVTISKHGANNLIFIEPKFSNKSMRNVMKNIWLE